MYRSNIFGFPSAISRMDATIEQDIL
jgi:hypothetical protein